VRQAVSEQIVREAGLLLTPSAADEDALHKLAADGELDVVSGSVAVMPEPVWDSECHGHIRGGASGEIGHPSCRERGR
jgi:hypothetical protein